MLGLPKVPWIRELGEGGEAGCTCSMLLGHIFGAYVIAGGGEQKVFRIEGLTEGGGRGIVVRVAEVFLVVLQ